jgi:PAS domain S-box-containing protein
MKPDERSTNIILDSISDGVFTVDDQWRITSFNRAAEEITGIARRDAIGQRCCDVFRASICEGNCALRETFETGQPIINKAIYIIDSSGSRIPISISTALLKDEQGNTIGGVETFRDLSSLEELRKALEQKYLFQDIVSKNGRMLELFAILPEIAESNSTVLIEGESGTGKELVARAIHNLSHRKTHPIVTVNCGALPETLLESELFGYKAGAFTDARKDKLGRFSVAEGGTIFLDEIADVSLALQVRLLRVIQERTFEPLGSNEPIKADVRILAASNRNLQRMMKIGKFREDLFYRINVIRVKLPPLRDRKEDIPLLVDHFIARFNKLKNRLVSDVSPDVLAVLMGHDYPGNVRELENIIEHAVVLCRGSVISMHHLPDSFQPTEHKSHLPSTSLKDLEARFITEILRKNNWNHSKTAKELGMHKTTLWRKMKRLGIHKSTH